MTVSLPVTAGSRSSERFPRRIVCLTEETVETIYLLGEQDRIVGVSGYTVRPPEARLKPKVSAFTTAKIERILALEPDLVLGFSDLQAGIASELIRQGATVLIFNQRSVEEIFDAIALLASILGCEQRGCSLVAQLRDGLRDVAQAATRLPAHMRVFFEEWNEPLISGIRWVEELVEIAGGQPIFPELRNAGGGKDRIVTPAATAARDPEVVIASWCGAKVNKDKIRVRAGWENVAAVRNHHLYEIKSTYILQPGPAALTEGVRQVQAVLAHVCRVRMPRRLAPRERCDPQVLVEQVYVDD